MSPSVDENSQTPQIQVSKGALDMHDRQKSLLFLRILFLLLKQECPHVVGISLPVLDNHTQDTAYTEDIPYMSLSPSLPPNQLTSTLPSCPTRKQMTAFLIHQQANIIVQQEISRSRQSVVDESTVQPQSSTIHFITSILYNLMRIQGIQRYWNMAQSLY